MTHPIIDLPPSWTSTTLDEVCLPVGKVAPFDSPDDDFTYLDISSIDNQMAKVVWPKVYVGKEAPSRARQLVRAGDILFSTVRTYLRNIATVTVDLDRAVASTGFCVVRPSKHLDPRFAFHFLQTDQFIADMNPLQRGTNYPAVRNEDVLGHPFPLPPLTEQHRIVAEIEKQLTRLDASVAALRRAKANLKRYRASVLKDACEGRLVPTEASLARAEGREYEHAGPLLQRILEERRARWESQEKRRGTYKEPASPDTSALPELPEGWVWATVSAMGEVRLGRQRSPAKAFGPNLRPYLRAANLTWEGLALADVKEMDFDDREFAVYQLAPGDIVLSEASGSVDEVGKPAVWNGEIEGCCFQNTVIRVRPTSGMTSYLYHHLLGDARSGALGQAARGVGIHHLGAERMESWPIAIPPIAEQHRIVAEVERRLSGVQQAEATVDASLRRAERLRQSVLKRAFEGKLVPQDPDDEPAAVLLEHIRAEREAAEASAACNGAGRRGRGRPSKRKERA